MHRRSGKLAKYALKDASKLRRGCYFRGFAVPWQPRNGPINAHRQFCATSAMIASYYDNDQKIATIILSQ